MIYGYARVSTQDQNLDSQIDELTKYGVDELVEEKIIGVSKQKPLLDELLSKVAPNDPLVVTRMDRVGRNTIQLFQLVERLRERDVHFVILNLGIDTRTPTGKFFLTVMVAFSELDREIIKDKHQGMNHAIELRKTINKTVKEICAITGISQAAFYRRLKEMEKDNG